MGFRGVVQFIESSASYIVVNGSADLTSCVKVACPANSFEIGSVVDGQYFPACKCGTGYSGVLSWSTTTNNWGTCTKVGCPLHSHSHPNCACDGGYTGEIIWEHDAFHGVCLESSTTPTWGAVPQAAIAGASCSRLQGAVGSTASSSSDGSLSFAFTGDESSVTILRCDIKLETEFTKVRGQFNVQPLAPKAITNTYEILQWNPLDASPSTSFIAFGTEYTIVDPGREMGTGSKSYTAETTISIPEVSVVSTDTIRIEIQQKFDVSFALHMFDLQTYNLPVDVIKCSREETP